MSNKANGYRDLLAVIDLSTYRRLAWEKNMPLFLCSFIVPETGEWLAVDPRSALKGVLEKAEKRGWKCMSGAEFEVSSANHSSRPLSTRRLSADDEQYFQFKETPASLDEKKFVGLQALTPGSESLTLGSGAGGLELTRQCMGTRCCALPSTWTTFTTCTT